VMNRARTCPRSFSFVLAVIALTAGCTKREYEIGQVEGTLVINGQPGKKVHIEFVPDVGVNGPRSAANTDEKGAFTLHVMERDGSSPAGAVVGNHKVILSDLQLSESATGQGVPVRFGTDFTSASSTPLKREVNPGTQTIDLQVP
jgi:hypothetical protein